MESTDKEQPFAGVQNNSLLNLSVPGRAPSATPPNVKLSGSTIRMLHNTFPMHFPRFPELRVWLQPLHRLVVFGLAAVLMFNLAACNSTTSATDAARTAANIAKSAADLTGNESLKAVVTPVVNLLNTAESQLKADNVPAAATTMKGFRGLWDKAAPVVKVATGSNYGAIDKGVKILTGLFEQDTAPNTDKAIAAVGGLIKPLSALLG